MPKTLEEIKEIAGKDKGDAGKDVFDKRDEKYLHRRIQAYLAWVWLNEDGKVEYTDDGKKIVYHTISQDDAIHLFCEYAETWEKYADKTVSARETFNQVVFSSTHDEKAERKSNLFQAGFHTENCRKRANPSQGEWRPISYDAEKGFTLELCERCKPETIKRRFEKKKDSLAESDRKQSEIKAKRER